MLKNIVLSGLKNSGKTTLLIHLLNNLKAQGRKPIGIKPFEIAQARRNAADVLSDAELINKANNQNLSITLVNPFLADDDYPFEFAFSLYHGKCPFQLIEENLQNLRSDFDLVLMESLDSAYTPIDNHYFISDLLKQWHAEIIYVFDINSANYSQNLANIDCYKMKNIPLKVILNNTADSNDTSWIQYVWQQLQDRFDVDVICLLRYNPQNKRSYWEKEIKQIMELLC